MESKARERVEAAEIESYRLKGREGDVRKEERREKRTVVSVFYMALCSVQLELPTSYITSLLQPLPLYL